MIYFYDKIFFLGLFSLPLLAVIYLLYRRSRPRAVSSLILWEDQLRSRQSGFVIKKLPLPLSFFLELLALLFITLAAALPLMLKNSAGPLTLILDNSYSMRAGSPSAKEKAMSKINSLMKEFPERSFNIILADTLAGKLGTFKNGPELENALKRWRCDEADAALDNAVALAGKLDRNYDESFLFTDRLPEKNNLPENFTWMACGSKISNTAIVNALRTSDGRERCMVIAANLSDSPVVTKIHFKLRKNPSGKEIEKTLSLAPNELKKIDFNVPPGAGDIEISLDDDALNIDNTVVLRSEKHSSLKASVALKNKQHAELVATALNATGKVETGAPGAQLFIGDGPAEGDYLTKLIIIDKENAASFSGPYTVNRRHSLSGGIGLKGTLWGASPRVDMPGTPLIVSGKNILLSVVERSDMHSDVYLNLAFDRSTLQNTPDWPILFWNLADWTIGRMPGLRHKNCRLGEKLSVRLPPSVKKLRVSAPDGNSVDAAVPGGNFTVSLDSPGCYHFKGAGFDDEIQVNPLNYDESDLRGRNYGIMEGTRHAAAGSAGNYQDLSWLFVMIAAAFLSVEWFLVRRRA